jgi:hypothetical protein
MSGTPSVDRAAPQVYPRIQIAGVRNYFSPGRQLEVSGWDSTCAQSRREQVCELSGIARIDESDGSTHAGQAGEFDMCRDSRSYYSSA